MLPFINNSLYSEKFLQKEIKEVINFDENLTEQFDKIKKWFHSNELNNLNEAQLGRDFIDPILHEILGWEIVPQHNFEVQGKKFNPDFLLFKDEESKQKFLKLSPEKSTDEMFVVCENKAFKHKLDDNKAHKDNPHFQIVNYLMYLKKDYGFLTNGRFWRFYDTRKISGNKVFYEVDLEGIVNNNNYDCFKYFYHIFKKDNFVVHSPISETLPVEEIHKKSEKVKTEIEKNLKDIIYGFNGHHSIFEIIGKEIYKKYPDEDLTVVYENALYFVFRILFIFYFEDKYADVLKKHKHYNKELSLNALYQRLEKQKERTGNDFGGYRKLRQIFTALDEGDAAIQIPVFNGGLFARDLAKLLNNQTLMSDEVLFSVLDGVLFYQEKSGRKNLFKRDFKTLSVVQLGSIYEGLLEFCFEKAPEQIYYLEYRTAKDKESRDCYVDSYDYQKMTADKENILISETMFKEGDIYLKSSNNSRKQSASYYTPEDLSSFLTKSAVDEQLKNNPDVLRLRIIDNACGSGHFLVECLNYVVSKTLKDMTQEGGLADGNLIKEIEEEAEKIKETMLGFEEKDKEIDHAAVLKRILLKKIIYGVDSNHFAVELTKLSLWIDTFIFGTPLSFLKHHIKTGNSLIGAKLSELDSDDNRDLFQHKIMDSAEKLKGELSKLMELSDTTAQAVGESKQIYETKIVPLQKKLNSILNYISYVKMKKIEGEQTPSDISLLNDLWADCRNKLAEEIECYAVKYRFFNYEVEFPEVYAGERKGFDIIIGNPPWDKTKFDDRDFFSQYSRDYRSRSLPNSKKKEIQKNYLAKAYIKEKYERERKFVINLNEYYKNNFPYNQGVGDNNLFRFFVENNLKQLASGGSLAYIVPSALMFEKVSGNLRKYIFENFQVKFFYSFENRKGIFKSIHRSYKFALIQIVNNRVKNQNFDAKFMILSPSLLENKEGNLKYSSGIINTFSPVNKALFEFKSDKDLPILEKAYKKFPLFSSRSSYLDFRNELHMTKDKDLFSELAASSSSSLPLYEGKMIHQFNCRFSQSRYYLDPKSFDSRMESKEIKRFLTSLSLSAHMKMTVAQARKYIKFDREFYRLAFRAIASDTNERTLIFSMIPKNCGAGNSLFVSIPKIYLFENDEVKVKEKELLLRSLFCMSVFNSLVADFMAREMVQMNVGKTYVSKLPIPQPQDEELLNNKIYKKLVRNALILTLKNSWEDFKDLAVCFNIKKEETELTEKQSDFLRIENDISIAALYGITKQEMEHIISTFKVLNSKNPSYCAALLEKFNV